MLAFRNWTTSKYHGKIRYTFVVPNFFLTQTHKFIVSARPDGLDQ